MPARRGQARRKAPDGALISYQTSDRKSAGGDISLGNLRPPCSRARRDTQGRHRSGHCRDQTALEFEFSSLHTRPATGAGFLAVSRTLPLMPPSICTWYAGDGLKQLSFVRLTRKVVRTPGD